MAFNPDGLERMCDVAGVAGVYQHVVHLKLFKVVITPCSTGGLYSKLSTSMSTSKNSTEGGTRTILPRTVKND